MTPEQSAEMYGVTWDRLLGFARRKFPKLNKYGEDQGGDATAFVRLMQNTDEVVRIAQELRRIDTAYELVARPLEQQLRAARDIRQDAEKKLLQTIKLGAA